MPSGSILLAMRIRNILRAKKKVEKYELGHVLDVREHSPKRVSIILAQYSLSKFTKGY